MISVTFILLNLICIIELLLLNSSKNQQIFLRLSLPTKLNHKGIFFRGIEYLIEFLNSFYKSQAIRQSLAI